MLYLKQSSLGPDTGFSSGSDAADPPTANISADRPSNALLLRRIIMDPSQTAETKDIRLPVNLHPRSRPARAHHAGFPGSPRLRNGECTG